MRGGGAGQLACRLAGMPENQAAALVAIESLGQMTSYHERVLDTGLSLEASREVDNRVPWAYEGIKNNYRERWGHNMSSRRSARVIG